MNKIEELKSLSGSEALSKILENQLQKVDEEIIYRLNKSIPLISDIGSHLINASGKRLRPLLTLSMAAKLDDYSKNPIILAAAVEFIHTATLLHDDVVDESDLRRGKKTANIVWGNEASVLAGDFLFAQSFELMVETNSLEARIATRRESNISLDSTTIKIDTVLLALENLKRHKLLLLVASGDDNSTYDDVVQLHEYIKNLIQPSEVSVSFRLDNVSDGLEFNRYIKKEGINNKVDKNTKVVYNLNNKLPKPLYSSNWIPDAIILLNSNGYIATRKVLDCYPSVDLVIHLNNPTMIAGYGEFYMKRGIHRI
jgi:hypothetical protein